MSKLKQTLESRIEGSLRRNPNVPFATIAKNIRGASVPLVRAISMKMSRISSGAIGFDEFVKSEDPKSVVRNMVMEHLSDQFDEYYGDDSFRNICGIRKDKWREISSDGEFQKHRLVHGRHNLWAPQKMISKMKQILGI